jgi:hypothetical protein
VGICILNHMVQYLTTVFRRMQGRAIYSTRSRGCKPPAGIYLRRYGPST